MGQGILTGHHVLVVLVVRAVHCTNLGATLAVCSRPGVMPISFFPVSDSSCLIFWNEDLNRIRG